MTVTSKTPAAPQPAGHRFRALGLAVLEIEAKAVAALAERVDEHFERACEPVSYTHPTLPTKRIV